MSQTEQVHVSDAHVDLKTMKAEIDALQISMAEQVKPWYRQSSIIISCIALLFSFGTTFYSEQRTRRADVHNAKVELRELIQRLNTIPQRNVDLDVKYAKNPAALLRAGSNLNTEQIVLAKQAVDIMDDIPDHVTATEYYAVASAFANAGTYDRTLDLFQRAFEVAEDANDWIAASRSLATSAFALGDVTRGRDAYGKALTAFDRYPTANKAYIARTNAYTETFWAQSEVFARQCDEARQHADKATGLSTTADSLTGIQDPRFNAQLTEARKMLSDRCG